MPPAVNLQFFLRTGPRIEMVMESKWKTVYYIIGLVALSVTSLVLAASRLSRNTRSPELCADARQIDRQSTQQVNNLIGHLVSNSTFFSVFSVALDKPCPFWRDDDAQCVIRECSVQDCKEEEIPESWRNSNEKPSCSAPLKTKPNPLNNVDRKLIGLAALVGQPLWNTAEEDSWIVRDEDSDSVYVDLRRNLEQYTGYSGPSSERVWQAIYDENCLIFSEKCRSGFCDPDTCKEERLMYSLISGLHASISMHIAKRYLRNGIWGPNIDIYKQRLRAHPERIRNLNVAYAVVLRALSKASTSLHPEKYNYHTGNEQSDRFTQQAVNKLFDAHLLQPHCEHKVFDESDMFLEKNRYMLPHFRGAFRNISMIMDCVGCEKCRLWGKLQFLGLGTALRILFEEQAPEMERNEIIALLNVLYKLSTSVLWVEKMEAMVKRDARINGKLGAALGIVIVLGLSVLSYKLAAANDLSNANSTTASKQGDNAKEKSQSQDVLLEAKEKTGLQDSRKQSKQPRKRSRRQIQ